MARLRWWCSTAGRFMQTNNTKGAKKTGNHRLFRNCLNIFLNGKKASNSVNNGIVLFYINLLCRFHYCYYYHLFHVKKLSRDSELESARKHFETIDTFWGRPGTMNS